MILKFKAINVMIVLFVILLAITMFQSYQIVSLTSDIKSASVTGATTSVSAGSGTITGATASLEHPRTNTSRNNTNRNSRLRRRSWSNL